jgi:hypothetical protein
MLKATLRWGNELKKLKACGYRDIFDLFNNAVITPATSKGVKQSN